MKAQRISRGIALLFP